MTENKMGNMNMKKLIVTMSIPVMLSMLIQALYNIVDSMFIAYYSQEGLTAVSLCYPVQMIMVAVACGTGVGVNSLLSRFLGENEKNKANSVAMHGIFLAICNGIVFAVLGFLFAKKFLMFFSNSQQIISMGVSYMRICTLFSFGVFVQITYERIMQSTGNTFYNMVIQGVGAIINIVLDPIFIFGYFGLPALGVTGAAIATVIGQIVAMILGMVITQIKIKEIELKIISWRPHKNILKQIYRVGFPAILMQSIMSFMTVFMNVILIPFSALAVTVFSIYYKLQQFIFMAVTGMTNALIPIIAYNYGANHKKRIQEAIGFSLILSAGIMLVGTVAFELFPVDLLYLFDAKTNMLNIGIPALQIISISFVFAGISMVICAIFQAIDQANDSLFITLLRQLIILLPLTWILGNVFGLNMCWWAFPITEMICAIISLYRLKIIQKQKIKLDSH